MLLTNDPDDIFEGRWGISQLKQTTLKDQRQSLP